VLWPGEIDGRVKLGAVGDGGPEADEILDQAVAQLREYFAGARHEFDLPLDPVGTEFQQQAWQVLRSIPYGETISYGEQARRLGDVNKSRAAGAANGRNPISIIVPCHRVVGSTGKLTGFAGGLDTKAWLLHHESAFT
jgi:methylated-DNA-[protein]-cysteine S-methyltransferase